MEIQNTYLQDLDIIARESRIFDAANLVEPGDSFRRPVHRVQAAAHRKKPCFFSQHVQEIL